MTKTLLLCVALGSLAIASACGDNSKKCGDGTTENDGVCEAGGGSGSCGPGTMADPNGTCVAVCTDGTVPSDLGCVIDPTACQGGTVLVGGECLDPGVIAADLEEGAEPNGLGALVYGNTQPVEASTDPAGVPVLKAAGAGAYVIHGSIVPADHDGDGSLDPDIDTYLVTVDGPTLLHTSADGINGMVGGYEVLATFEAPDTLANYRRYAASVHGDTAHRDLLLPRAGTYRLVVADTRTLLSSQYPAVGADDTKPAFEYYVSLENVAIPTPQAVTLTNGHGSVDGTLNGDVKFFSAELGSGFNVATVGTDSSHSIATLINFTNGAYHQYAREQYTGFEFQAALTFAALDTDTSILVLDPELDYEFSGTNFHFDVTTGDAVALSTTGAQVKAQENGSTIADLDDVSNASTFYFDVAAADTIVNMSVVFDQAAKVLLVDQDLNPVSRFTWGAATPGSTTMTAYRGQFRFRAAGRYYFLAVEPTGTGATMLGVTSTLTAVTPAAVVHGTPLTAQAFDNKFLANTFSYVSDRAVNPWQAFDVTGVNTGTNSVAFLDKSDAYGRLDALATTTGTRTAEPTPVFAHDFAAAGGAFGRILIDDPVDEYLVHVHPATADNSAKSITLNFADRNFHDYDTISTTPGATTGDTLADLNATNRYLARMAPGTRVTIAIDNTTALNNVALALLDADESVNSTVNATGIGGDELTTVQSHGWVAFEVTAPLTVTTTTYNTNVSVLPAVAYTIANSATAFADACTGGTNQTTADGLDRDEDVTAPIALPAGFMYYGFPVTTLIASTNGFASLGTTNASLADNLDIPAADGVDGIVAPYWDDLDDIEICTKTVGMTLVVQWTGTLYYAPQTRVRFQAIFDASNNAIEFVWDPDAAAGHQALGDAATIGIEDQVGATASKLGFEASVITLGTNKKLTPGS